MLSCRLRLKLRSGRYSASDYPAFHERRFGRGASSADPRRTGEWIFFSTRVAADRRRCAESHKPERKPTAASYKWLPGIAAGGRPPERSEERRVGKECR